MRQVRGCNDGPAPFRSGLLPTVLHGGEVPRGRVLEHGGERRERGVATVQAIFGSLDLDDYREAVFKLCYTQHGGSGLSFSYEGLMDMPLDDFLFYLDRLDTERQHEHAALTRAHARRR